MMPAPHPAGRRENARPATIAPRNDPASAGRAPPRMGIRVESLSKSYATDWRGRHWRALDGVSFAVPRGTVCGLIGPNGSGKSTTLKILAGLTSPDASRAEIMGVPAGDAVRRGLVGYLPDQPALPGFVSGRALLVHLARLGGRSARAAATAADMALETTGLADAATRRVSEYSKGMRQRLGLAQTFLHEPEVLLLDEPVSGLDPRATEQLGRMIRELAHRGPTILLASHFLPQLEELCDQVVLLDRGRVLFAGSRDAADRAGGLHRLFLERTSP
jgi:ABC-2 type transport system ATP-binding protein